jgi:hypothetical protein
MKKKTLVIGASTNPERYSFKAIRQLLINKHEVLALGLKPGDVDGVTIQTGRPHFENLDTVTLYIGPAHQPEFYDYILALKPKRIIFNPGTENPAFEELAARANIKTEEACTLVLLSVGAY